MLSLIPIKTYYVLYRHSKQGKDIAVFACITCLVGIALGTLCGGALLETWEGMGWFTGGLDRVKALVILSTVLRVLVAVCLVPPLENDRDETMGHMLSDIAGSVLRRKPRA